jgi:signal transduction histidine kinase
MMADTVLLVGDDPALRSLLEQRLAVVTACTAAQALSVLQARAVPVMVACDPDPPGGGTAIDLLRAARTLRPAIRVVLVASHASDEQACEAMRQGADDFMARNDPALARLPWIVARLAAAAQPAPALIASISHDLRTPLAGLHALIQMMEGGADGPLTPPQRARLLRIRAAADRLASIADHLSDLSLLSDGRLSLSPGHVDLGETAAAVMRQADPLARSRAIELRLALPAALPPLRADAARLRQALSLTLSAAIKRADGGVVELSAEAHAAHLELRLREIRRPLPVEALPSEFEALPAGSRVEGDRLEGALGISVARGLLRLHGGDLRTGAGEAPGLLAVIEVPWDEQAAAGRPGRPRERHPRPG